MATVKYNDGIEFADKNGKLWVFPVLSIGFVEVNMKRLWTVDWVRDPELILDILLGSLQRNYAKVTREEVGDAFDFDVAEAIAQVIVQESCLPIRSEEGKVLGLKDLKDRLSSRSQTSAPSTHTWLQRLAGHLNTSAKACP